MGTNPFQLTVAVLASLVIFSPTGSKLAANTYPAPYDAKGEVLAWQSLLTSGADRYGLIVLEPFESLRPYHPHAPSTELAETRYVFQLPDDPGFVEESRLVEAFGENETNRQSLLVHCSFTTPGRQHFEIRPAEPLPINGQPFRMSVWVHSQGYRHRLEFLFRNGNGQPVRVDGGHLLFKGWRRLDITLPAELNGTGKRIGFRFASQFEGIVIHSHPAEDPGSVALLFDNLLILTDLRLRRYPGAEINDSW